MNKLPLPADANVSKEKSSSARDDRVSQALAEFVKVAEQGGPLDVDALLAKYADVAEDLTGCIETYDFMRNVAPQLTKPRTQKHSDPAIAPLARLGDFRIVREVGRGGMGVVYEAEQLSLGRRMALKVLPFASMLDKQQLNRFKNEARAAATLDHPNIVAVHSVGEDRGVHYYAMQLVEGQSLAEVIAARREASGLRARTTGASDDSPTIEYPSAKQSPAEGQGAVAAAKSAETRPVAKLSTVPAGDSQEYFRAVAQLGVQAAQALDHAHQSGIVHRDIKPGNLLVDAEGKLYVTDFGLARIEADAGMTLTGDLLGTLRYMSPEQALAKRVVIDHRTDIYSLGVTLYELLTLQPPYEGSDRQELFKKIAFDEPRRLRQINSRIPVDLETIVAKAIEKNPDDRYATAQELAEDLGRFLGNQTIIASPPNIRERVVKWSRRHQSAVVAAAGVLLLLLVVATGATMVVWREKELTQAALDNAQEQRKIAEQSAAESDALVDFFVDDLLGAADPEKTLGDVVTVQQVVEEAERRINQQLVEQPLLEAAVLRALGKVHASLGNYSMAEKQLERARSIQQRILGLAPETLETMSDLADVLNSQCRIVEARQLSNQTLELMGRVLGDEHPDTVGQLHQVGVILAEEGNLPEATETLDAALRLQKRILGNDAEKTLTTKGELALLMCRMGRFEDGRRQMQAAVERMIDLRGKDHPRALWMRSAFASLLMEYFGVTTEVRSTIADLIDSKRRIYGPHHPETLQIFRLGLEIHHRDGAVDEALQQCRTMLKSLQEELGENHPQTLRMAREYAVLLCQSGDREGGLSAIEKTIDAYRNHFGADAAPTLAALTSYADILWRCERYDHQRTILRQLLEARRRVGGPENPLTLDAEAELGICLDAIGLAKESREILEATLERHQRVYGPTHYATLRVRNALAQAYADCGDRKRATQTLRDSLELHQRIYGPGYAGTLKSARQLAMTLIIPDHASKDEIAEARDVLVSALKAAQESPACDLYAVQEANYVLANCYRRLDNYAAAIELYRSAVAWYREAYSEEHFYTFFAAKNLGEALSKAGQAAEATAILEDLVEKWGPAQFNNGGFRLEAMHDLGLVHARNGELDKAAAVLRDTAKGRQELLGADDPATLVSVRAHSGVLRRQGRLQEAYQLDQQVGELRYAAERWGQAAYTFGEALKIANEPADRATTGLYLSMALWRQGKRDAARDAFATAETILGETQADARLQQLRQRAAKLLQSAEVAP